MNVLILGKYPPIQGGVSMRTVRFAEELARAGHAVHVVTNANEARPPFRMLMRDEDWARCETVDGGGSLRIHWTEPVDRSQHYVPFAAPFVTKLAALGADVAREHAINVVFAYYMEPYGISGHLVASMCDLPLVVKTAGSDARRLWRHPQFKALYDHVFRNADLTITGLEVAQDLVKIGVARERIRPDAGFRLDLDLFAPEGEALDVASVMAVATADPDFAPFVHGDVREDLDYIGVYGKVGPRKGSDALLGALALLAKQGRNIGLLAMAHGRPQNEQQFRARVQALGLTDRVVQLPFLPHWRVPAFIRRCRSVCCLEQDFPITIHRPAVAHEVLAAGAALVASTELLMKLPANHRLVHRYNCIAVRDVNDEQALAGALDGLLSESQRTATLGVRARDWALDADVFDGALRVTLADYLELAVAARRDPSVLTAPLSQASADRGTLSVLFEWVPSALRKDCQAIAANDNEHGARAIADFLEGEAVADTAIGAVVAAFRFEDWLAHRNSATRSQTTPNTESLFRIEGDIWPDRSEEIAELRVMPVPGIEHRWFNCDANQVMAARTRRRTEGSLGNGPSCVAVMSSRLVTDPRVVVLDEKTGALLERCNGEVTVADLLADSGEPEAENARLIRLFEYGLVAFHG